MRKTERWRDVPEQPGYQVSDHGRFRSVDRVIMRSNGSPQTLRGVPIKTHSQHYGRRGKQMRVRMNGKDYPVHRIVLLTFEGPPPPGKPLVRHLDDDHTNNHISNLRYGTVSENSKDAIRNGRNMLANRTHCSRGHEYTPENTYRGKTRRCKICHRAWLRESRAKKRKRNARL